MPTSSKKTARVKSPPRRILVTGGAGFIGQHLCRRLLDEGHTVICADNFSTGSRTNIAPLLNNPCFRLINHDVTGPLLIDVDQIYNLACPASPIHYQVDPVRTTKTSVLGALNMLELARRSGISILQTSTSEIYGDPTVHPQGEDYWGNVNPVGMRACYDEGKRCAETLFFDFHRQYGVNIKVCRLFNTYGPGMHPSDGRVISNFIVQALQNRPITVYGDGSQTRSFCYIDDMLEALTRVMDTPDSFIGPINLGNPVEFTIMEVVQTVKELTRSRSEIVFRNLPQDDPRQRQPDISLARQVLGWEPLIPLREGLTHAAIYFDDILRREGSEETVTKAENCNTQICNTPIPAGRGL
jgi:UDP-glucuronate decarboxylase